MKVFIAGARSIKILDDTVKKYILSVCKKEYEIFIGDCYGVDSLVQEFLCALKYKNVTVFASDGAARNNKGNWKVRNIKVMSAVSGFDFYKQKDIAMANESDCGIMVWDGKSRGTLNNIINLVFKNKPVLLYFVSENKAVTIKNKHDLNNLVLKLNCQTQKTYNSLISEINRKNEGAEIRINAFEQLSVNM